MRGRKPKPTALKILAGNPGKRALPREPRFAPAGTVRPPSDLSKAGKAFWAKYFPILELAGVIQSTDLPAFEAMCRAWANFKKADREMAKPGGMVQVSEGGYASPSPWVSLRGRFHGEFRQLAEHFGLTPSSRSRIKVSPHHQGSLFDAEAAAGGVGGGKDELAEFLAIPANPLGRIGGAA